MTAQLLQVSVALLQHSDGTEMHCGLDLHSAPTESQHLILTKAKIVFHSEHNKPYKVLFLSVPCFMHVT